MRSFSLIIMDIIACAFANLIDGGNSCDVMHVKLFEKLRLKMEKLWP